MMRRFLVLSATLAFLATGAAAQSADEAVPPQAQPDAAAEQPTQEQLDAMSIGDLLRDGRRLVDEEHYVEAAPYLAAVIRRAPETTEAKVLYAEVLLSQNDLQNALTLLSDAYDVNRNDFRTNLNMGRLYLAGQHWRQATNYLQKAKDLAPPDKRAQTLSALAAAYVGASLPRKAIDAAREAKLLQPNDYDTLATLVRALTNARDYDQALAEVEALEKLASERMRAAPGDLMLLQQLYAAREQHINILRLYFQTLTQRDPGGAPTDAPQPGKEAEAASVTNAVARLLIMQARTELVLSYYQIAQIHERALQFAPNNPQYWFDHAMLLMEINQFGAARQACQRVLELAPEHAEAKKLLERLNQAAQPSGAQ